MIREGVPEPESQARRGRSGPAPRAAVDYDELLKTVDPATQAEVVKEVRGLVSPSSFILVKVSGIDELECTGSVHSLPESVERYLPPSGSSSDRKPLDKIRQIATLHQPPRAGSTITRLPCFSLNDQRGGRFARSVVPLGLVRCGFDDEW